MTLIGLQVLFVTVGCLGRIFIGLFDSSPRRYDSSGGFETVLPVEAFSFGGDDLILGEPYGYNDVSICFRVRDST